MDNFDYESLYLLPGEKKNGYSVYLLTFPCGKTYTGQTRRFIIDRLAEHAGASDWTPFASMSSRSLPMQDEFEVHGTVVVSIVGTGLSLLEAEKLERDTIGVQEKPLNTAFTNRTVSSCKPWDPSIAAKYWEC